MKTRGIIDFYLPEKIAIHLKIILGGVLFSTIWSFFTGNKDIFTTQFLYSTIIIIFLMELGVLLGFRFFNIKQIKTGKGYSKKIILRLMAFYLIIFSISALIFFLLTLFSYLRNGYDLSNIL